MSKNVTSMLNEMSEVITRINAMKDSYPAKGDHADEKRELSNIAVRLVDSVLLWEKQHDSAFDIEIGRLATKRVEVYAALYFLHKTI